MDALTLEDVVRKFDLRFDRIEQFLPTLATKAELQAATDRLATKAELQAGLQSLKVELRGELATKTELQAASEETRRYMKMLVENLGDEIRILAEGLVAVDNRDARQHQDLLAANERLDARVTTLEAGRRRPRSR